MDPITATIALLTPYFLKSADAFAEEIGKEAYAQLKNLVSKLRDRWRGTPKEATLDKFAGDPKAGVAELKTALGETFQANPNLVNAVDEFVRRNGPAIQIVQEMREVQELLGIEAKRMTRGTVRVEQKAENAGKVTGAKFDEIG